MQLNIKIKHSRKAALSVRNTEWVFSPKAGTGSDAFTERQTKAVLGMFWLCVVLSVHNSKYEGDREEKGPQYNLIRKI